MREQGRDGRLVRGDLAAIRARATAARDALFERAAREAATADARIGGGWIPGAVSAG